MTTTPREPTREESALQAMGPDALMNAQGEEFSAGPANMEIYRRLKERDALLAQAPKVWTAEEIKDAPGGFYVYYWHDGDPAYDDRVEVVKSAALEFPDGFIAVGPLPQPPPPEEKGAEDGGE